MCASYNIIATSEISLTSSPPPSSNGYFCPGPVQFTCVGTDINGLTWRIISTNRVSYNFLHNYDENGQLSQQWRRVVVSGVMRYVVMVYY